MTGTEIKIERIRVGLTQFDVSLATGIHPSILSLIESERRQPTAKEVELISNAFTLHRRSQKIR